MTSYQTECELLHTCEFFKTYGEVSHVACKSFIQMYCKGPKQHECKRKEYRRTMGNPPSAHMMPNGNYL